MPTFICSLNWTDQGNRSVKDAPKRAQAARELAKKVGVEIKEVYLTSGDNDLLVIVDTPNGDNVAKFALALGSQGTCVPVPPGPASVRISKANIRASIIARPVVPEQVDV